MSQTLTLYTYGAGELLQHFFMAIASQHDAASPYRALIHLVTLIAGTWALLEGVARRQLMATLRWLMIFMTMFYLLFLPTVSLNIVDRTHNHTSRLVDGVPIGLAVTASITSQIGDGLTHIVEPLFSNPKELRYQHSGMLMGSQLMQASRTFTLQDSALRTSLTSFMQQCVFYDLALGRYRIENIKQAPNLWLFLKEKASHARAFVLAPENSTQESNIVPCFEGVKTLDKQWRQAIDKSASHYAGRWFPNAVDPKRQLLSFLPLGLGKLQQLSSSGATILQQILLEKSFEESMAGLAAKVDAPAALSQYAFVKAQQQHRMNNDTVGHMAAYWLPLIKNVFEAMLYGAFLLVFLLCLFPFGPAIFKNYIFALMWVQSWAPLYAIINGVISFYLGQRTDSNTSVAYISDMQQVHSDMVGLAGYLSMSVPFIAMGLVRSLAGTFTQMASSVAGVAQSAASSAASEAISGNISLGNMQVANSSAFNTSMNHWDTNASMQAGQYRSAMPGGSTVGLAADGSVTLDTRPASSNLNVGVHLSNAIRSGTTEAFERSKASTLSHMQQYNDSISTVEHDVLELAKHQSHLESGGDSYSLSDSAQSSQNLQQFMSLIHKFSNDHQITDSASLRLLLGSYANAKLSALGFSAGLKVDGNFESSTQDQKLYQDAEEFSRHHQLSKQLEMATRAGHDHQYHDQNETSQRLADNLSHSLEKSQHAREELQASMQQTVATHKNAQWAEENAASIVTQADQAFANYLQTQPSLQNPGETMGLNEIAQLNANYPERLAPYAHQFESQFTKKWLAEHQAERPDIVQDHQQSLQKIPGKQSIKLHSQHSRDTLSEKAAQNNLGAGFEVDRSAKTQAQNKLQGTQENFAKVQSELDQQHAAGSKYVKGKVDSMKRLSAKGYFNKYKHYIGL